ncbi:MAG: LamG-like jellyroll fold domain-containing protein [Bacteroidota bacterium]|nr:LamG-like jellyroll fold domain-containing protein [Bacteroidota bacterium]
MPKFHNPLITAFTGGISYSTDGIFIIQGADYVTIDGIDLHENAANTTAPALMDWGYAIVKLSETDGSQNINIKNCTVTLAKLDAAGGYSTGIYSGNHTAASTTPLTITDAAGINSNIKINGCTLTGCYYPISINGFTTSSTFYDTGLEIGTTTGNTIKDFGGGGNGAYGIAVNGQSAPKIENNSVTGGANTTNTVNGIFVQGSCNGNITINSNTDSVSGYTSGFIYAIANEASQSATVNITNNTIKCNFSNATTGTFRGIYNANSPSGTTVNITGNTIQNIKYGTLSGTGSGGVQAIVFWGNSLGDANISNNIITNNAMLGQDNGTFYGIFIQSGGAITVNSNQIFNNSISGAGNLGTFYGIYTSSSNGNITYNGNSIYTNQIYRNAQKTKSSGTGNIYGFYVQFSNGSKTFSNNIIYGLASGYTGSTYGIYSYDANGYGTNITAVGNNIYDLSSSTGLVYGIYIGSVSASTNNKNIYNNFISDLKTTGTNNINAINGLYLVPAANNTVNCFFNTVYLNATSAGTDFGSSGIFVDATSGSVDLRNNIIVNKSTAKGAGFTAAYRRGGTDLTNYASTSNNNLFYAGTPSAANLIFYDGTNSDQTLAAFQSRMATRDANSVTEDVPFVNISNAPYDLHINTGISTVVKSGGIAVTSPFAVTTDYDGDTRMDPPDIGADEFYVPTAQATDVILTQIDNNIKIDWTNGSGSNRAVFISQTASGSPVPVNGPSYTANKVYGAGTQIGSSGWYCVYNGSGSTVTVSNISVATYRVMVCEYNGTGSGSSYNVNTATNNPQNITITTIKNNCLSFDGKDDYVSIPANTTWSFTDFTVEWWQCEIDTNLYPRIFSLDGNIFGVSIEKGNEFYCWINNKNSGIITINSYKNQWVHFAITRSDTTAKIYRNGIQIGTFGNGDSISSTKPLLLGKKASSSEFFGGNLDEIRFWSVARSQVEIQANMNNSLTGSETGLVAYYKLDQGTAGGSNPTVTTLNDATDNGHNGTLTNFALTGSTSNWVPYMFIFGDGTQTNPYLIANLDHLLWISENSARWSSYYKQTDNIDASSTSTWNGGAGWLPIGNSTTQFTGNYDGNGKTISGLYINRGGNYVGLFGYTETPCSITSLGIVNVNIIGSAAYLGALVGLPANSNINKCYSTGTVTGLSNVGGLIGHSHLGSISNCYSRAVVIGNSGSSYLGGLIGYMNGGTADYVYSTGSVTGTSFTGGLVGQKSGTVTLSFWDTQTSGQSTSSGGLGETTAEMKTLATFTGWDNAIWNMDAGINDGYPYLDWQNTGGTPLPVELSSFTATVVNRKVTLKWQTATEVSNHGFNVELKKENNEWKQIGFVKGNGNSNSSKSYSFVDTNPPSGKAIYRLKQIDTDGKFEYSKEIEVNTGLPKTYELSNNYPNPFNPSTRINVSLPEDQVVKLCVYNILGEKVATLINRKMEAGVHEINFNAANLASGIYIYKIEAGKFTQTKKMMLIK